MCFSCSGDATKRETLLVRHFTRQRHKSDDDDAMIRFVYDQN